MKKEVLYQYLGTNGTILSPVHLEDIYYIRKIKLTADSGKILINNKDERKYSIIIPEDEVQDWQEILAEIE